MNPIALSFADGTVFFVGLVLVLACELMMMRFRKRIAQTVLSLIVFLGIFFVALSATPLPGWMYLVWGLSVSIGFVLFRRDSASKRKKTFAVAAILLTTLSLCAVEVPYHIPPELSLPEKTTIYVIGDSISAGVGLNQQCWPTVLNETSPYHVVNLAQAGATVNNAIDQAKQITVSNSLVIVEIGGNDMLGGTDASLFRSRLETLLSALRKDNHQVLILELPLFPFQNSYGGAQRSLAWKYQSALLPKRYFTRVLGMHKGTIDGLHLSQEGHGEMAGIIAAVIKQK